MLLGRRTRNRLTIVLFHNGEGIPNIDYLEKPGKLKDNIRDNLLAPMFIAQAFNHGG